MAWHSSSHTRSYLTEPVCNGRRSYGLPLVTTHTYSSDYRYSTGSGADYGGVGGGSGSRLRSNSGVEERVGRSSSRFLDSHLHDLSRRSESLSRLPFRSPGYGGIGGGSSGIGSGYYSPSGLNGGYSGGSSGAYSTSYGAGGACGSYSSFKSSAGLSSAYGSSSLGSGLGSSSSNAFSSTQALARRRSTSQTELHLSRDLGGLSVVGARRAGADVTRHGTSRDDDESGGLKGSAIGSSSYLGGTGTSSGRYTGNTAHSPPERESAATKAVKGLVGLRNLGNTCFLNSVIQCLSNSNDLRDYCLKGDFKQELNMGSRMKGALMEEFARLLQALWSSTGSETVSPQAFKTQIQKYAPRFMGYNQQDAQEFLRFLLDGLHGEVNRVLSRPRQPISDDLDSYSDDEKAKRMWKRYLEKENSKIVDLFVGQLKSSLKCSTCDFCSTTFDPFWDLSLPISQKSYDCSLVDCIRLFTKEEVLDGDERPTCSRCKARRKCTKKFTIQKFPKILVLHLKRFSESSRRYQTSKLSTFVDFPLRDLDLGNFAADKNVSAVYNLYAVANHSGTTMGGHYIAYGRPPGSSEWHCYNDSRVTPLSIGQVRSSEAYVLFYELSTSRF